MPMSEGRFIINADRNAFLSLIGFDKDICKANGNRLISQDGCEYMDFTSQYGVMALGHNHSELQQVVIDSLTECSPVMIQPFSSRYAEELGQRLITLMPSNEYRHVLFTCTGAETVEAGLKLARSSTGRSKILSTHNSFHGKTEGAVKVTGKSIYREPFHISTDGTTHIVYGDFDELERELRSEEYAAFIVEPIQGEGGMVTPPEGYLQAAQSLCEKYRTLLIADEIQTGLGRTGYFLACEYEGITPDILLLSKSLSGGLIPLGAMVAKEKVWTKDFGLYHSSTFANNNLACRVALSVLNKLTEDDARLVQEARRKGEYFKSALIEIINKHPNVYQEVSGRGLMLGLKLKAWSGNRLYLMSYASSVGFAVPMISGYLLNRYNIICLPALNSNDVLRIQPPLNVSLSDIDMCLEALSETAAIIEQQQYEVLVNSITCNDHPYLTITDEQNSKDLSTNIGGAEAVKRQHLLGKFAFFLHPTDEDSLYGDTALGRAGLSVKDRSTMEHWVRDVVAWSKDRLEAGVAYHAERIHSKTGDYVEGYIITSLLTPKEMMRLSPIDRHNLFDSYFEKIADLEVDCVGLGAYTSVISKAGIELTDRGFTLTTGNSLTALSCANSLIEVAAQTEQALSDRSVMIVGAYGSVGRLAALSLSSHVKQLILLGNPLNSNARESLKAVAGEIYQHLIFSPELQDTPICLALQDALDHYSTIQQQQHMRHPDQGVAFFEMLEGQLSLKLTRQDMPIVLGANVDRWLPKADAMLAATSFGRSFIDTSACKSGMIICDAAQPPDLIKIMDYSSDLFIYGGGELLLPEHDYRFGQQNITGLDPGKTLACLGETMVVTMSQIAEHQSLGKFPSFAKAQTIYDLAQKHGFEVYIPKIDIFPKLELLA